MLKKKVLVHGTLKSLQEFFASPFNREYEPIAILSDDRINVSTSGGGLPLETISPVNLPKRFYNVVDGVVLTDNQSKQAAANYFLQVGVEPRKIILWNAQGKIEPLQIRQADGTPVVCMEGLEFHIRKPEDGYFANGINIWLQQQRQFYAINPNDYPAVLANTYLHKIGKPLDWNNLQTWTEKMQWIKLYDSTPLKTRLADKYLVRYWVAEQIGEEYLIPLLGVWDNFDDIDFDTLPDEFVLKCNHGSGMNIIVRDKNNFDIENAREKINGWLAVDYGSLSFELHYSNIKRKIVAEKLMKDKTSTDLTDYKFWCFDGIPRYCKVMLNRSSNLTIDYFDMDWKHMDFKQHNYPNIDNLSEIHKPKNFALMKKLATKLCKDFEFVRVDFYEIEDRVYFGEMTFAPGAANIVYNSKGTDEYFGSLMTLPNK